MKKVLIAVHNGSGRVHKEVFIAVQRLCADERVDAQAAFPTKRPYVNNLHQTVKTILLGDWDYLISIDDDNPPLRNIIDLIVDYPDIDVIGCPTPIFYINPEKPGERPYYFNAWKQQQDTRYLPVQDAIPGFTGSGLVECDAVGTGCIIVKRRVFEAIPAPFMRVWGEDGVVERGNDIAFCERVKKAGFSIAAHFDYPCAHFKEVESLSVISAFHNWFSSAKPLYRSSTIF